MYLIEAVVPRNDCSRALVRFASQMAKERDLSAKGDKRHPIKHFGSI